MENPKKPQPDGYFKRGFMGAWDIKDGHYVDEIAYLEDYKMYQPVYFSTEPPVPKEVLDLIDIDKVGRDLEYYMEQAERMPDKEEQTK